jgi:hypothetical protein
MSEEREPYCPDCEADEFEPELVDRRAFFRAAATRTAAVVALGSMAGVAGTVRANADKDQKPAESLVRELYSTFSDDQKKELVVPWDHGAEDGRLPTRMRMYNSPILGKTIGKNYTKAQQELLERIVRAISSDEEGYKKLSRNGTWDTGGGFQGCGAVIFGEPVDNKKFAWVFSGHHLTVRCDGNSEQGEAFGGPMFYGHSPNGYSDRNCFNFQTKSVISVYDALDENQRKKAVSTGSPGEQAASIRFKKADEQKPGISIMDLTKDQRKLVETVMRDILAPYRKEDADNVMNIVKTNGGLEKIHLAFYKDRRMDDNQRWHFWRLDGPGFVWNYRVLPHVHTYVHISSKI